MSTEIQNELLELDDDYNEVPWADDELSGYGISRSTSELAEDLEDMNAISGIKSDLRDFADSFTELKGSPTLKKYFYGKILEMPRAKLVKLILSILNQDEAAMSMGQEIVDDIIANSSDLDETPVSIDYSELTIRELEKMISSALSHNDISKAANISNYIRNNRHSEVMSRRKVDKR